MPSFDIVSEVDNHELTNAIDQANRELANRFDFKGVDANFEHKDGKIVAKAPEEFQINQMKPILNSAATKRGIDAKAFKPGKLDTNLAQATLEHEVINGLDQPTAKKIVKIIKDEKFKVQASIQGDKVRVTGKKRDDLQEVIAFLKDDKVDAPLQFDNFRD